MTDNLRTRADRLLAENVQSTLDGLDGLFRVHGRGAGHDDRLQGLLLREHLLVVGVGAHAVEFLLGGVQLGLDGRADGN